MIRLMTDLMRSGVRGLVARAVVPLVLLMLCVPAAAMGQAPGTAPPGTLKVSASGDLVTLEAVDVPLDQVLRKLGEVLRTRIVIETVLGRDLGKTRVTRNFNAIPSDQAFRRLLVGRNYALMQGKDHVDELRVFDGTTGSRELAPPDRTLARPTRPRPAPPADAPQDEAAEAARLRQTALSASDASERRQAMEELSSVSDEKLIRDTLLQALARECDTDVLQAVLSLVARQDDVPADALRNFVASDRDGSTRAIALDHLVAQTPDDPATRTLLRSLASSDANQDVREAASNALESLEPKDGDGPAPVPARRGRRQ